MKKINPIFQKLSEEVMQKLSSIKVSAKDVKGEGEFTVIATTDDLDRHGEIISIDGWDFKNYMKNPIVLWAHNYWDLDAVVGAVTDIKVEEKGVVVTGVFANTPAGQAVRKLYEDGIVRTVSVGFIPLEFDKNTITKAELLEISFVPVPANPNALSTEKMAELVMKTAEFHAKFLKPVISDNNIMGKTAIPYESTPAAPEDTEWDADAATARWKEQCTTTDDNGDEVIDFAKFKKLFAWYDSENPDLVGSYKLPHHDYIDGELKVVWQGTVAAMGALLGARGGTDIPESDREEVYNHLKAHYEQFDKEPPEFSSESSNEDKKEKIKLSKMEKARLKVDVCALIDASVFEEESKSTKAGRVLSAKSLALIITARDALSELVEHATADDEEKAIDAIAILKDARSIDKLVESMIKNLRGPKK